MQYFISIIFSALTRGSMYALLALGYSMIYGIIQLINFAHGELYMIGAFAALIATVVLSSLGMGGLALLVSVVIYGAITSMLYAYTLERIAYRPLRKNPIRLSLLISAVGMSTFLQNFVLLTQTANFLPFPKILPESWQVLSVKGYFNQSQMVIFIVSITIMIVLALTVRFTLLGKSMRAASQDIVMAQLLGINVNKVIVITFLIGGGIAAVGGVLIGQYVGQIQFYMGFLVGIKAFVAAVLGGIGSIPGTVLGSYMLGFVESMGAGYLSSSYEDVYAFLFLILFLIFKPNGILGSSTKEKV